MMHSCSDCGLVHEAGGELPESDAVKIARLEAERDVKVAQLSARADAGYNEARVEVAELEAEAAVDVAEVTATAIAELAAEGEPAVEQDESGAPVLVIEDPGEPEPAAPAPPIDETPAPSAKKRGPIWPYGG